MSRGPYRWLLGTAMAILLVTAAAALWVYTASEAHLHSFASPPGFSATIGTDATTIERGKHLVDTRGCRGCHGKDLEGGPMWGYAVAPNLPELVRKHGVVALEAGMRHGIGVDGSALYSMPAYSFIRLRDQDVAAIGAYLSAVPVKHVELPAPGLPWSIRWNLARGTDKAITGFLAQVPPLKHAGEPDSVLGRGEYLAMTTCIECHGFELRGDKVFGGHAPDLIVVAAYDEAAFARLMRTGKALGDRELEMMSPVARGRFAHFTDEELRDLYAFLRDMAAGAAPPTTPLRR
jgi:mono/diheme cytochrome c family protein